MKNVLMTILVVVTVWAGVGLLSPTPVAAAGCGGTFLTFRAWWYGLVDADCKVITPIAKDSRCGEPPFVKPNQEYEDGNCGKTGTDLTVFVWAVILNVLSVMFSLVGFLALGFLIFGGYQYVLAKGDPNKIAKGKKTVVAAITGLVISILASLIVNTIVDIITRAIGA